MSDDAAAALDHVTDIARECAAKAWICGADYLRRRQAEAFLRVLGERGQAACHSYAIVTSLIRSIARAGGSSGMLEQHDSVIVDTEHRNLRWRVRCTTCEDRHVEFVRCLGGLVVDVCSCVEAIPVAVDALLDLEDTFVSGDGVITRRLHRPTKGIGQALAWIGKRLGELSEKSRLAKELCELLGEQIPPANLATDGNGVTWFWALREFRRQLVHHPKSDLMLWDATVKGYHIEMTSDYLTDGDSRREIRSFFAWVWGEDRLDGFAPLISSLLGLLNARLLQAERLPLR